MNKLSLKLAEGCSSYNPLSDNNYALFVLGMFLSTENTKPDNFGSFYKWLKDENRDSLGLNLTKFDKVAGNIVVWLEFDVDNYNDDPEEWSLIISADELVKIINDWNNLLLLNPRPAYIILLEENNKYSAFASDKPDDDYELPVIGFDCNKIVIKLLINGFYKIIFQNDYMSSILAKFLIEGDVNCQSLVDWMKSYNGQMVFESGIVLQKIDDTILLYLNSDMQNYKINPQEYSLSIEIKQFIYIVEKWKKLLKRKMRYAIIKYYAKKYSVIGSSKDPNFGDCDNYGIEEDDYEDDYVEEDEEGEDDEDLHKWQ